MLAINLQPLNVEESSFCMVQAFKLVYASKCLLPELRFSEPFIGVVHPAGSLFSSSPAQSCSY